MAQSGLRSFGDLARLALAQPTWPKETGAQVRSLEAIFGRLDRGEDLDWLADRPGVQQVLASVLSITVAELRTIILGSTGQRRLVSRLRLDDLRQARSVELTQEPLPPSIPERIGLPGTWRKCCWVGEPGSGFGIAAQWLSARGLAQTEVVDTREAMSLLPVSGPPLFVELDARLVGEFTAEWHGTQPICLALSGSSHDNTLNLSEFDQLRSTDIAECLEQVLDWIWFRIPSHPTAARSELLGWIRSRALEWGLIETLGDVLGVAGAWLEGSIDPTAASTKEALLRQWTTHHSDNLARERHRDLLTLRSALPDVLIDIAQAVLSDDGHSPLAPRTIDEWLSLVPEHHRRGPDIDWLTNRLVSDNLPLRKPDLERAVKRLPPGAHRIIVALRELHWLKPVSATRFSLRPHFLARLVQTIAKERLVCGAPFLWGEALLRSTPRRVLHPALQARAQHEPELLAEELLEHLDSTEPAVVCAFETSFVLLGLSVLQGADISEPLAASLLQEQDALLVRLEGTTPFARTTPRGSTLLADHAGAFFLAAWSLSERTEPSELARGPALDPWHAANLQEQWPALLDCVLSCIRQALASGVAWLPGALALLDRLRHSVGAHTGPTSELHELFLTGDLLDAFELGVLDWSATEKVLQIPWRVDLLIASAPIRGVRLEQLTTAMLTAWADAGHPPSGQLVLERWPSAYWQGAAPDILISLICDASFDIPASGVPWLSDAIWHAWQQSRRQRPLEQEAESFWQVVPRPLALTAMADAPPRVEAIRRIIWRRFADLALDHVERCRLVTPALAADWLRVAHVDAIPTIAQYCLESNWTRATDIITEELRRLMHRAVAERVPDWSFAYACLDRLESERHHDGSSSQRNVRLAPSAAAKAHTEGR